MRRWIRYGLGALLGVIVVAVVGALYQFTGSAIDRRRYPPPGKLVDVGGYRLHLYCTGHGSPTIVMDAGGGQWSLHWSTVQPEIAKFTRVCSYDRAGYGWSDSGPSPRTAQQVATELHTLLVNAQITGPYVLVAHSFSGFTARLFRNQHADKVVGMVLVDAGHEDVWQHQELRKAHDAFAHQLPAIRVAVALGVVRLLAAVNSLPPDMQRELQQFPPEARSRFLVGSMRTSYVTSFMQEDAALQDTHDEVRAIGALDTLGDLPLIVLTSAGPTKYSNMPAGIDPLQFNKEWLELQQKLTALSTRSTQLLADKSSHNIQLDQPEVVVDGVQRAVGAARRK